MIQFLLLVILTFTNLFTDMLSAFELIQHTAGPTYNQGHTLDLVISKGLDIAPKCVLDVGISDHFCICFNIDLMTKYVPGLKLVKRQVICGETSDRFIARYTNSVRCSKVQTGSNSSSLCDNLVNNFNDTVTQIMDIIAPIRVNEFPVKQQHHGGIWKE